MHYLQFCAMNAIKRFYNEHPLRTILALGLFFRLIAVIFSKGFGMHDDHFLVIEAAQSWADGYDYNNWLPWNNSGKPSGHSWFYVGLHFFLLKALNFIGLDDPQGKMYIVRFLHAIYSMGVIVFGYRIARRLGNEKDAIRVAWFLALMWFIPSSSVRNLVEWVCVVPLLLSSLYLIKAEQEGNRQRHFILSGLFAGIAMSIRFQSLFFLAGTGLYLLYRGKIKGGLLLAAGFVFAFFITQGADLIFYHRPFVEVTEYIQYNLLNATTYFDRPWYQYLLTVGGMLIPPVSIFLIIGYCKAWKKVLVIILPSLVFFLFHSWFPNKQERFILPFIPFFIIAGTIGWGMFREGKLMSKAELFSWRFFWILNTAGLLVLSTTYSKRSMTEAMYYLYQQPDFNNFIMEVSHRDSPQWPPQFYSGKWNQAFCIYKEYPTERFVTYIQQHPSEYPHYILFFQEDHVWNRIAKFKKVTGAELTFVHKATPSWFDALLHWLNPRNKNEPVYIFLIN